MVGIARAKTQRGELGIGRAPLAGDFEVVAELDREIIIGLGNLKHLVAGEAVPRHSANLVDDGLVGPGGALAMLRWEGQGADPVHCLPLTIVTTVSRPTKSNYLLAISNCRSRV